MPFTFSHPAIVLPATLLPKKWYSLTGLIIGSLTPDFEYFLRMKLESQYSHTISGVFWFDLPLGILLAFIFHTIVRNPLFDNLPKILKSRTIAFCKFDWTSYFLKNTLVVILSIIVGAFSHLFWDSFTHEHGYFVLKYPVLSQTISVFNFNLPILKMLQHSSTFLGGFVIVLSFFKLPQHNVESTKNKFYYWFIIVVLIISILLLRLLVFGGNLQLGNGIVTVISATIIALTIAPLFIYLKDRY